MKVTTNLLSLLVALSPPHGIPILGMPVVMPWVPSSGARVLMSSLVPLSDLLAVCLRVVVDGKVSPPTLSSQVRQSLPPSRVFNLVHSMLQISQAMCKTRTLAWQLNDFHQLPMPCLQENCPSQPWQTLQLMSREPELAQTVGVDLFVGPATFCDI